MHLAVDYSGVHFENPFVLASGPPTANADMISRAFDAGWAGAVIKTLILEPVNNLQNRFATIKVGSKIVAFKNIELLSELKPEDWYRDIRTLKKRFPNKIVIGSIMGDAKAEDQWIELARGCQDAGVDLIELNFSCPHGYPDKGKGSAIGQAEEYSSMITGWLKTDSRITVPIIPKLTAAVSDITHIREAVAIAGADGICAINTYPSLMGFDLKTLEPRASVGGNTTPGGYSGPGLKPIALKCVSDLVKNPGLPVMACGGVSSGYDAAEFILLGAPIVQVCTEVMLEGYSVVSKIKTELTEFMGWHGFSTIGDFLGLGNERIRKFAELDRDYAVTACVDLDNCSGCQTCFVSCRDAGYQVIEMRDGFPVVDRAMCRGCSLCFHVCPNNAISMVSTAG